MILHLSVDLIGECPAMAEHLPGMIRRYRV
jgi:hypothetical protein